MISNIAIGAGYIVLLVFAGVIMFCMSRAHKKSEDQLRSSLLEERRLHTEHLKDDMEVCRIDIVEGHLPGNPMLKITVMFPDGKYEDKFASIDILNMGE